ncbi:hypothetical protein R2R70_02795 [Cobetia sp. SIMBA_158]|uniref:hypothetical protein n=1 Tax=Cobetia sp. SIMBA_158 TaxID=3081617 RepID=UPI00397F1EC0
MNILEQAQQWTALLISLLNNGLVGAILGSITTYILSSKAKNKIIKRRKEFINQSIFSIKKDALEAIDSANENKNKLRETGTVTFKESIDIGLIKNIDLQISAELSTHEISALNSIETYSKHYRDQSSAFNNSDSSEAINRIRLIEANDSMCRYSAYIVIYCDLYLENSELQYSFPLSAEQFNSEEERIFVNFEQKYGKPVL